MISIVQWDREVSKGIGGGKHFLVLMLVSDVDDDRFRREEDLLEDDDLSRPYEITRAKM